MLLEHIRHKNTQIAKKFIVYSIAFANSCAGGEFCMEPQEYDREEGKKCSFKEKCFGIVKDILLIAFFTVIGIIIGAAISAAILGALAAIIVLAVVLGLLLLIAIILLICNRKKKEKKCKYYCCY